MTKVRLLNMKAYSELVATAGCCSWIKFFATTPIYSSIQTTPMLERLLKLAETRW